MKTVVLLIVSLGILPGIALSQTHSQDASRFHRRVAQPSWDMRYKAGSFKLKEGEWLKTAFAPEETVQTTAQTETGSVEQLRRTNHTSTPFLAITADQLRAAYFDPKAEKDSALMQRMPRSGCHYAESLMPKDKSVAGPQVFVVRQASPGAFSRALERLNRRHPVQLTWTIGDSQGETVLLVNDCEYASFLANLRQFTGERWSKIGHEFNK